MARHRGGGGRGGAQWDSPLTELPSPRGEEERDRPFSVVSELEPFWLWWSVAEAALDDVAEGLAFSLKSVMMTVRSPTVTSRCWALLRSMFFNLGLAGGGEKRRRHVLLEKVGVAYFCCWRRRRLTSSSCDCSSSARALCRSSPSLLSPSSPFWAEWATRTAALPAAGRRGEASWGQEGKEWQINNGAQKDMWRHARALKGNSSAAEVFEHRTTSVWIAMPTNLNQRRTKAPLVVTGDGGDRLAHEGDAPWTKCIIKTNRNAGDSMFHHTVEFPSSN